MGDEQAVIGVNHEWWWWWCLVQGMTKREVAMVEQRRAKLQKVFKAPC